MVFCCKQKTAYEMRISDWSSDVCSSDLSGVDRASQARQTRGSHKNGQQAQGRVVAQRPGALFVVFDSGQDATVRTLAQTPQDEEHNGAQRQYEQVERGRVGKRVMKISETDR